MLRDTPPRLAPRQAPQHEAGEGGRRTTGPLADFDRGEPSKNSAVSKPETGPLRCRLTAKPKRKWDRWISLCALAIAAGLSLPVLVTLAAETGYVAPGRNVA